MWRMYGYEKTTAQSPETLCGSRNSGDKLRHDAGVCERDFRTGDVTIFEHLKISMIHLINQSV